MRFRKLTSTGKKRRKFKKWKALVEAKQASRITRKAVLFVALFVGIGWGLYEVFLMLGGSFFGLCLWPC